MFLKVFKYDFIAVFKRFIPIVIVVFGLSIFARLVNLMDASKNFMTGMLIGIGNTIFIISLVTIMIYTIVLVIVRYVRSLFKDQGYLTHTLPVNKHQLLLSQLLVAVIMTTISILIIILGIFIAYFKPNWIQGMKEFLQGMLEWDSLTLKTIFLVIFCLMTSSLSSIFIIYLGIAFGHAHNKNKTLLSVVYCMALNYGIGIFTNVIQIPFFSSITNIDVYLIISIVISLVICIACYFLTIFMMQKHLNLE